MSAPKKRAGGSRAQPQRASSAAPAPSSRGRRLALFGLLAALGLAGYFAWRARASADSASRASGAPPIPAPAVADLEVPVQEILAQSRQHLLDHPDSAEAWGWYAAVLDAHHFSREAEPCYRRAHELDARDVRYSYNLAVLLELLGADPAECVALFRSVATLKPDYPPVHARLGQALLRQGDSRAALAAFDRALELDPKLWIVRRVRARTWIDLDEPQRAIPELEAIAVQFPADAPTQAALAQARTAAGDTAGAEAASQRARAKTDLLSLPDPLQFLVIQQGRSSRQLSTRAASRAAEGDWAGAAQDLQLLLRTRAQDPSVHERLAEAYRKLGQASLAERSAATARALRGGQ